MRRALVIAFALGSLVACGGGSGTSDTTNPPSETAMGGSSSSGAGGSTSGSGGTSKGGNAGTSHAGAGGSASGAGGKGTSGSTNGGMGGASGSSAAGASGNGTAGASGSGTAGASGNGTAGASGNGTAGASGNGTGGASGNTAAGAGGNVTAGASGSGTAGASGNGGATGGTAGTSASGGVGGVGGSSVAGAGGAMAAGNGGVGGASGSSGASGSGGFTVVVTIVLENHDYAEIVGSPNAPYINSLIAEGALATNYMDSGSHPSLPNYLYLTSGSTQYDSLGFIEYDPTMFPFPLSSDNLGNQLTTAGVPWRAYLESMGTACNTSSSGEYVARHNPFLYYTDVQMSPTCADVDVDYSQFAADLAAGTYKYMWISPNLLDDGHDPQSDPVTGLMQTDAWLATEVEKIKASPTFVAGGAIFITWDEAEGRNGDSPDQVPMIVVSPKLKGAGIQTSTALSHASYLATMEDLFGVPRLGDAKMATTLFELFQ